MNVSEQGVREPGRPRYQTIPRTLVLVTSTNPATGAREVLLLKGAPHKRLWANKYNGLGGHVEAGEDVHAAAQRELHEETGLGVDRLTLRGVVHIDTGCDELGQRPGVMMFVFHGETAERTVKSTTEGAPEWIPIDSLSACPLVDDLHEVIPRALGDAPLFFASYRPQPDGTLCYTFDQPAPNKGRSTSS